VLWQASVDDEPAWESLWGPGRPGWHIECTALAQRELGDTLDLHGGGGDLIFPHHECSAAQSQCLTGQPLARHWMHGALVWKDGAKMSKSLGNLVFISDLRQQFDPRAIRLMILAHHYRHDWSWSDEVMAAAATRLERWVEAGDGDGGLAEVRAALDADLDTPAAVAAVDRAVADGKGVSRAAALLGVDC
jgi:L-cysteine:1D-myo-inositol 2-amino-2-deoxy-alpha-D-glucopyranoside ligase